MYIYKRALMTLKKFTQLITLTDSPKINVRTESILV